MLQWFVEPNKRLNSRAKAVTGIFSLTRVDKVKGSNINFNDDVAVASVNFVMKACFVRLLKINFFRHDRDKR